jgi:hypothetical protein
MSCTFGEPLKTQLGPLLATHPTSLGEWSFKNLGCPGDSATHVRAVEHPTPETLLSVCQRNRR